MFARDTAVRTLPPAAEVPEEGYEEPFPLVAIEAPVLTGTALRVMLAVADSPLVGPVRSTLLRGNRIPQILEEVFVPERASFQPNTVGWPTERGLADGRLVELGGGEYELAPVELAAAATALSPSFAAASSSGAGQAPASTDATPRRHTAADFYRAYASGATTPAEVAERIIAAVAASETQNPPMRFFIAFDPERIRQLAAASTARWAAGTQLSPLDGVPFAVKDCVDALPYPTTAGTAFMAGWRTPVRSLAGVQALQDAGALLLGKTTLHEIGLGTTGLNLVTGTARNPHSPAHHTGGSSSGSAAVVAAGLCPFALGTDGGGSMRVPAACCGVVGLKPTHDRAVPPIDQTVAVTGPIGGTVQDTALMYALMANTGHPPGGHPAGGMHPPAVALPAALGRGASGGGGAAGGKLLAGLKAGIFWAWFDLAAAPVAEACRAAVSLLEARGLEVVSLELPELALLRAAHSCTIISEMKNNMNAALQHGPTRRSMNAETRASLAMAGGGLEASHYVQAQKICMRKFVGIFLPNSAFVSMGFEHGIANMYLIPLSMCLGSGISVGTFITKNLIPATLSNLIGGVVFVGGAYACSFGTPAHAVADMWDAALSTCLPSSRRQLTPSLSTGALPSVNGRHHSRQEQSSDESLHAAHGAIANGSRYAV
ncbi:fatty acid amide hydrolase-like [Micractinium conductrix]|uniref:Fatty acid amide hydrolase-like n=1 Tax=Micractinium conductrix TaxID=554055 RepID=A0A2P6V2Z4_9CHLO|nr:fatty acid amide hydrolase-like [Micractinium conductrix]|eukprot:PSC68462.1 fatty acid amide hydrolase-like [Micractinium conductrix]